MQSKVKIKIAILAVVLLLVVIAGYLWQAGFLSPGEPVEKITISTSMSNVAGLLLIAQTKGYFLNNGLEVTLKLLPSGNMGLEELKAGMVEFAAFTEFVLVSGTLGGFESLKCLGAIAAADDIQVIARKDRGILQPGDLKGKKVGVFRGSNADFFLGRFLTLNGLSLGNIEIVNLNPFAMTEALVDGKVDAVMVWEPVAFDIMKRLGDKTVSWPGQGSQPYFWLLAGTDKFIKASPGVVDRLLRALHQAEIFIKGNQDESIGIVANRVKTDPAVLKSVWPKYVYELSFDQSLIIAMEDEARWMIQNRLTDKSKVPNYLDYLEAGPLLKVNPKAVRLVLPGQGSPK